MIFTFETKIYQRRTGRRCRNIRKHMLAVLRLPSYMCVCCYKFYYTYPMLLKLPYKRLFRLYDDVCRFRDFSAWFRSRFVLPSINN